MRHGVIAIALVLAACSRSEPDKAAVRSSASPPVIPAGPAAPSESANYAPGEALKERLARQEAAARLLDATASQPPPARAPEPPKAAAKAPQPAKAPPPAPAKPPEPVKAAGTAPPSPAPSPPQAAPAKPEPVKADPPSPPRIEVAAAKPAVAPAPVTRLVQRVEPDFPREALQAGAENGLVQARMTLDERGNVTRVEVLAANPRRLFDRSVIRALSQWKYNDGAAGRTVEAEVAFRR
jgi:protein TonB